MVGYLVTSSANRYMVSILLYTIIPLGSLVFLVFGILEAISSEIVAFISSDYKALDFRVLIVSLGLIYPRASS